MITVYSWDACPRIKLTDKRVAYWSETEIGLYEEQKKQ